VLGGRLGALHLLHLRGEATQQQQEILVGLVANDQLDGLAPASLLERRMKCPAR